MNEFSGKILGNWPFALECAPVGEEVSVAPGDEIVVFSGSGSEILTGRICAYLDIAPILREVGSLRRHEERVVIPAQGWSPPFASLKAADT